MGILDSFKSYPSLILDAIISQNNEELSNLLNNENKYDINFTDNGESFLGLATKKNNIEACEIILSKNPNQLVRNNSLLLATHSNNLNITKLLLENNANPNFKTIKKPNPIKNSINNNNIDLLILLLNYGGDINLNILSELTQIIKSKNKNITPQDVSFSLLLKATELGYINAIKSIIINLDIKLDTDVGGDIIKMLGESDIMVSKQLLDKRISDLNKKETFKDLYSSESISILELAEKENIKSSIFNELINKVEKDGYLFYIDYLNILYETPIIKDNNGNTILHFLALIGDEKVFSHLWPKLQECKDVLNNNNQSIADCALLAVKSDSIVGKKINNIYKPKILSYVTGKKSSIELPIKDSSIKKVISPKQETNQIRTPLNNDDFKSDILLIVDNKNNELKKEIIAHNNNTFKEYFTTLKLNISETITSEIDKTKQEISKTINIMNNEINQKINTISNAIDIHITTQEDESNNIELIEDINNKIADFENNIESLKKKVSTTNTNYISKNILESAMQNLEHQIMTSIQTIILEHNTNKNNEVESDSSIYLTNITNKITQLEYNILQLQKNKTISTDSKNQHNSNEEIGELRELIFNNVIPNNTELESKINSIIESINNLQNNTKNKTQTNGNQIAQLKQDILNTLTPINDLIKNQGLLISKMQEENDINGNDILNINEKIEHIEQEQKDKKVDIIKKIKEGLEQSSENIANDIKNIKNDIETFDIELANISTVGKQVSNLDKKVDTLASLLNQLKDEQYNITNTNKGYSSQKNYIEKQNEIAQEDLTTDETKITKTILKDVIEKKQTTESIIIDSKEDNTPMKAKNIEPKILNPDLYSKIQNLINSTKTN